MNAAVVGRSDLVGKPLTFLLLQKMRLYRLSLETKNLQQVFKCRCCHCRNGKACFSNTNFIREGAVVIDVGTTG